MSFLDGSRRQQTITFSRERMRTAMRNLAIRPTEYIALRRLHARISKLRNKRGASSASMFLKSRDSLASSYHFPSFTLVCLIRPGLGAAPRYSRRHEYKQHTLVSAKVKRVFPECNLHRSTKHKNLLILLRPESLQSYFNKIRVKICPAQWIKSS